MAKEEMFGHVFMSYSRTDEDVMRRIMRFLRNQGINVWVDNENLVPGTPIWESEIEKAIIGASATVVILSPESKESVWVRREISYSEQYRKRIFPVLVSGDEDSSITLRLITRQYVDIRANAEIGLNMLSTALSFYLEELESKERNIREAAREKANREDAEKVLREKVEIEMADKIQSESVEKANPERSTSEDGVKPVKTDIRRKNLKLKKDREAAERVALQNFARRNINQQTKLPSETKMGQSARDPFIHSLWWFITVIAILIILTVSLLSEFSRYSLF